MPSLFLNWSRHPSRTWGADELAAARALGNVVDVPFPTIRPELTMDQVQDLAADFYRQFLDMGRGYAKLYIHVGGEMSLCLTLFHIHLTYDSASDREKLTFLVSTSRRSRGAEGGAFEFVQFREIPDWKRGG
ncbi:MAG: hypothetical protein Q8R28_05055 [Dehalococcoidia bacterium]|nr:hypothetical protein [Dehalococcoidia bacterium]